MGNTWGCRRWCAATAVHPHGRGEHVAIAHPETKIPGSSPRAWGTPRYSSAHPMSWRFIPTGVGNTPWRLSRCSASAVHPHGRGEHAEMLGIDDIETRFIPTGVGNTSSRSASPPPSPVHPHGRGEHIGMGDQHAPLCGSSPRAWGTQYIHRALQGPVRFIPTGVGNTTACPVLPVNSTVHPHGRGEHALQVICVSTFVRFIPTGVGNTAAHRRHLHRPAVHPHGRGEHLIVRTSDGLLTGSSPRAWGTHHPQVPGRRPRRFIPTGVGNT